MAITDDNLFEAQQQAVRLNEQLDELFAKMQGRKDITALMAQAKQIPTASETVDLKELSKLDPQSMRIWLNHMLFQIEFKMRHTKLDHDGVNAEQMRASSAAILTAAQSAITDSFDTKIKFNTDPGPDATHRLRPKPSSPRSSN